LRFRAIGASDLGSQLIATIVAIVLAASGAGLWALVAQQVVSALAAATICVALAGWWPKLPHRHASVRRFLRFGAGVFGTQGISYLTKNVDNIAIGAVYGPTPLGLYSRAYQLMMMPLNQINAPMTNVAVPVLSRVQHDDRLFVDYLRKSQLVACYVTATLFAVATGLAEPIVLVLFGKAWSAVTPLFAILAVGGVFRAVAQIAYWAYLARGASGALFRQRLVTGPLTIGFILAGLPWGAAGVAWGASAAGLMAWLVAVIHVGRVTGFDSSPLIWNATRIVVSVGVPCGLVSFSATLLAVTPILQIVLGLAFSAAYVGLAYALIPLVRQDLDLTLSFARRAFTRTRPA
ncbi:MAG: oligosaccharide flippase family protein, partial [Nocardioidaceae bacterium]